MADRQAMDGATEKAARAFIGRVRQHYAGAEGILFGSRARRDHQADSDADIAVLLPGQNGAFLPTKLALADIAFDVLLETGVRVQPLPIWAGEWRRPEDYRNPALLAAISRDGIRL